MPGYGGFYKGKKKKTKKNYTFERTNPYNARNHTKKEERILI